MVLNQLGQLSSVGWVSPSGRNPTNRDAIHENVGLRDETANTSYKADVFADIKDTAIEKDDWQW